VRVECGGLRVGLIGLLRPMVHVGTFADRLCATAFADPVEAAAEASSRLAREADVVLALTHCFTAEADAIAALPEVSLALAGHTHATRVVEAPGRLLVESGCHAAYASVITYDADAATLAVERRPLS
jgi:2',3'-cyclic-nucleotide 2'-phosphodiesterase (5'-nucleotidase family)